MQMLSGIGGFEYKEAAALAARDRRVAQPIADLQGGCVAKLKIASATAGRKRRIGVRCISLSGSRVAPLDTEGELRVWCAPALSRRSSAAIGHPPMLEVVGSALVSFLVVALRPNRGRRLAPCRASIVAAALAASVSGVHQCSTALCCALVYVLGMSDGSDPRSRCWRDRPRSSLAARNPQRSSSGNLQAIVGSDVGWTEPSWKVSSLEFFRPSSARQARNLRNRLACRVRSPACESSATAKPRAPTSLRVSVHRALRSRQVFPMPV